MQDVNNVLTFLKKKWLSNLPELSISLHPDPKFWEDPEIQDIEFHKSYQMTDIYSAYDCPQDHSTPFISFKYTLPIE